MHKPDASEPAGFVLYDSDCPLCRTLAEFVGPQVEASLSLLSWQEFVAGPGIALLTPEDLAKPASELRVWSHSRLYEGAKAWQQLSQAHPGLNRLNWLVGKIGLEGKLAPSLNWAGHRARKLCFRCGGKK